MLPAVPGRAHSRKHLDLKRLTNQERRVDPLRGALAGSTMLAVTILVPEWYATPRSSAQYEPAI